MRHELFTYDVDAGMVERVASYVADGFAADEAAIVVTTPHRQALLRKTLGAAAESTLFFDRDTFYSRPEAVIAAYDAAARRVVTGRVAAVRVMGELPICEHREEWDVWLCYEAILNRAFAHHPARLLCGYDTREVPGDVIEMACRTHPVIAADQDGADAHEGYVAPEEIVRALGAAPISGPVLTTVPLERDPRRFREVLLRAMADAEVIGDRADRMLIAAGEVLANAQHHGGGLRSIRVGRIGDRFVCELTDGGRGIDDPLVGYVPPRPGNEAGAGLWVARQLTWRLELVPSAEGFATRLWV